MKRFFTFKKKSNRQKLEEEALSALRKTRAQLQQDHPGLLSKIRALHQKAQDKGAQPTQPAAEQKQNVPIDRAKNMETIARFLQITNSETIKKSLRDSR